MITVGDKSIKLQIWDTVCFIIYYRLVNNHSSPLQEGIIDLLLELFLFMTLLIDSLLIMLLDGLNRLN